MHGKRRYELALVTALLLTQSCRKAEDVPTPVQTSAHLEAASSFRILPSAAAMSLLEANYPLQPAGTFAEVQKIAGFHDQQAFIVKTSGADRFGPMAGLYMGPRARDETELAGGALVAVVEVDAATDAITMPPYARLRLISPNDKQLYCVFLKGTGDDWWGDVVKASANSCGAPSYDMPVRHNTPSYDAAEYPAAVRFDEDKDGPTIGVPCNAGWCEIADKLATSALSPINAANKYTHRVKGWHDEQRIATNDGGFQPGVPRASITPIEGLASKGGADFQAMDASNSYRVGLRVAEVMVKGTPPTDTKYADWNFQNGKSQLWIRNIGPNAYEAQFVKGASETKAPDPTGWIAVDYGPHTLVKPPGVARWIWNPADEGVWVACDQGCCEISQATKNGEGSAHKPPAGSGRGRKGKD